ncbi:MAG: DUF5040 domain-containing protein [Bacteroidaceae bacterium]|nr:DUF5040 domain-containing protein [Bacteroidaceae bacterium]
MKNTTMKIKCWKLEDGNEVPMPPTATLDGFEWNGRFRITVSDDDGSLGLPFLFAADDTAIMTVETSEQKGTHTGNKKIKQILRCVPHSLGEEVACSRIRSHNGNEHVWSEWEQASSSVGTTVEWDSVSCIDSFVTAGVYNITGERLNASDGLPIENSAPGHTISARLTVLNSSITGTGESDDKCITQILSLSNRTGGDGDVYIRTGRAQSTNMLAGGSGWEPWGKLQQNIEVGQVTSLNNFIGNGIYSGVYTNGSSFFEAFVMVVINNYAVAGATGQVRSVSQFKYALNVDSTFSYKTRTGRGNTGIEWGSWVDLGAATTTDIQDNSITAQKLSSDVREKVEAIAGLSELCIMADSVEYKSFNMLNSNDLLTGYSLSEGQLIANAYGIFSNRLYLEIGKAYTIKDVSTFQHSTLENIAVAIFIAKFDSSDVYLGRDSIKPSESPTLGDGYVTVGYTPTDESVAYYRVLLQSQSNLEHPYDATRAMVYEGTDEIDIFIPYNPIPVFAYDKVQDERISNLEVRVNNNESEFVSGGILLTGASFAYNENKWFSKVCDALNARNYNKAVSGESIRHTAVKMHNGALYSKAEFENFDTLLIMHVHNQDVCDDIDLQENYSDYEVSTSMSYSQAYDYVLKKYAAECYAAKDNPESKWYGTQCGKPCKVVCMTHWHDSRTVFNDSIRRLRDKWGFGLIELDKNIGFSKNQIHSVTGAQVSVIHAQDTEVIDGVTYGWHPSRATDAYIQDRIAEIVVKQLSI